MTFVDNTSCWQYTKRSIDKNIAFVTKKTYIHVNKWLTIKKIFLLRGQYMYSNSVKQFAAASDRTRCTNPRHSFPRTDFCRRQTKVPPSINQPTLWPSPAKIVGKLLPRGTFVRIPHCTPSSPVPPQNPCRAEVHWDTSVPPRHLQALYLSLYWAPQGLCWSPYWTLTDWRKGCQMFHCCGCLSLEFHPYGATFVYLLSVQKIELWSWNQVLWGNAEESKIKLTFYIQWF